MQKTRYLLLRVRCQHDDFNSGNVGSRLSFYELIPGFNHVVNINKASWMALSRLPGIGTQRAKRIVNNRPKGGYLQVTDILEIKGIGAKTFDAIKPFIGVDDTPTHWVVNQSPKMMGRLLISKITMPSTHIYFGKQMPPMGCLRLMLINHFV